MPTGSKCSFKYCTNKRGSSKLSLFRYPVNEDERCRHWIERSGNCDLKYLNSQQLRRRLVCAAHFDEHDLFPPHRLDSRAIPRFYYQPQQKGKEKSSTNLETKINFLQNTSTKLLIKHRPSTITFLKSSNTETPVAQTSKHRGPENNKLLDPSTELFTNNQPPAILFNNPLTTSLIESPNILNTESQTSKRIDQANNEVLDSSTKLSTENQSSYISTKELTNMKDKPLIIVSVKSLNTANHLLQTTKYKGFQKKD